METLVRNGVNVVRPWTAYNHRQLVSSVRIVKQRSDSLGHAFYHVTSRLGVN